MLKIKEQDLRKVVTEILKKAGSEEREADLVAKHLVRSNLYGHDSHGVGMVPAYVQNIDRGLLKPNTPPKLIKDDGAILVFDGQRGFALLEIDKTQPVFVSHQGQGPCQGIFQNVVIHLFVVIYDRAIRIQHYLKSIRSCFRRNT